MSSATDLPDGSWTIFGLPRSHYHCQLANFDWTGKANLLGAVREFLLAVERGEAPHLFLTGPPGVGKSHLSVAIYRAVVQTWGTQLATWIHVPQFLDRVRSSYGDGTSFDPFDNVRDARRFIALDDPFGRKLSRHESDQLLPRLIDIPYQNEAAMIVTANESAQEFSSMIQPHEASRLFQNCVIAEVGGEDRRVT